MTEENENTLRCANALSASYKAGNQQKMMSDSKVLEQAYERMMSVLAQFNQFK